MFAAAAAERAPHALCVVSNYEFSSIYIHINRCAHVRLCVCVCMFCHLVLGFF